jgi:hypothetical protein
MAVLSETVLETLPQRKTEKHGIQCMKNRTVEHVFLQLILKAIRKNK